VANFHWWRRCWNGGAEIVETTVKMFICCGFRRTGKAMGQVYVEDMLRNKCFILFRIPHVLSFVSICGIFTDSPSYFQRFRIEIWGAYHFPCLILIFLTLWRIKFLIEQLETHCITTAIVSFLSDGSTDSHSAFPPFRKLHFVLPLAVWVVYIFKVRRCCRWQLIFKTPFY
jgi:hypothetical protein